MKWTILDQISLSSANKIENFVMFFSPPATRDPTKRSSGFAAQHVRSSTFGQYRNSQCAPGGKTSVRIC